MTFVLSSQRQGSPQQVRDSFDRYRRYLSKLAGEFPPSAYALATSDWYFSPSSPRSPHDARLEELSIVDAEPGGVESARGMNIHVRLLNAYRDRHLTFAYSQVTSYRLDVSDGLLGHHDWRYDEFRLADDGQVIHEIEWAGPAAVGRWIIVSSDVELAEDIVT